MADIPIWCVIDYDDGGVQIEPKSWTEARSSGISHWPQRFQFRSTIPLCSKT